MRCTDYGKVNVRIRKNHKGKILLEYEPWGNDERTLWYCVLNARDGYTMRREPLNIYIADVLGPKPSAIPLAEAQEWLRKYCAYHRMNVENFMIVSHYAKQLTR